MSRVSTPSMCTPSRDVVPALQEQMQGLGSLGFSDTPNKEPYWLVFDFSTAIANGGGSQVVYANVDAAGDFVVTHMLGTFWTTAVIASSVAGTAIPWDNVNESGSNELPCMAHVGLLISSRSWQWMNAAVRASLLLTDGRNRNWLGVQPLLKARDVVAITATNNAASDLKGQIAFGGYRQPGN